MVIDEIGSLPITRTGAMVFFHLLRRRYEHAAIILTSNSGICGETIRECTLTRGWTTKAPHISDCKILLINNIPAPTSSGAVRRGRTCQGAISATFRQK
jgi:hypothetical protein